MPLSVVPTTEPTGPLEPAPDSTRPEPASQEPPPSRLSGPLSRPSSGGSRWVDYDAHELLEMIGELEDERRWARLREGILWAVLIHILVLSSITWIPRYVFKVPPVIDPFEAIQQRKDLKYLDLPPDLISKYKPKEEAKPVPKRMPQIDKKTLDALNTPPAPPVAEPKAEEPAPKPLPPPPVIPPSPQTQSQLEAPQPKAVPARPNFAMGSQNPADQLRDAMRNAARNPGGYTSDAPAGGLSMHPGAGGGVQVLSDTQGVDFNSWLQRWHWETERTWDPLIPDEVNPPILKQGQVMIRFKVAPNGRIIDGSMVLEGRSGDTALDRAAWGALTGSSYPPLPREFHGPYLELRAVFMYNMRPE